MSRKKISTTIYVTPEQNEQLKVLHDRTKVPTSVYIREGIDLVLRHYAHLLPGQLPLGKPEKADKPERADRSSADVEGASAPEKRAIDRAVITPATEAAAPEPRDK